MNIIVGYTFTIGMLIVLAIIVSASSVGLKNARLIKFLAWVWFALGLLTLAHLMIGSK